MTNAQRHCIVTALSREKLDAQVCELIRLGWRPLGEIAVAKSVNDSVPPYFCQSMVCDEPRGGKPWSQAIDPNYLPAKNNPSG
jgi:hypothetical protein